MKAALELAARGAGRTSPNPQVGAVLVKKGRVIGEGFHLYEARDHAEVVALREAGAEAAGSDLYVTLEPCNHQGRTPPCVDRILESKVRRVFIALLDPNREVGGRGAERLRAAGVEVEVGLCEEEARRQFEAYLHYSAEGRPFVQLKLAMTLDGRIATAAGESQWITGPESRELVHRLRFEADAVAVGVNTILADDPSLDVRWREVNSITRVILDSSLRTPPEARAFERADPVILCHAPGVARERKEQFKGRAELLELPREEGGLAVPRLLEELGRRRIQTLLVEGGGQVAASFLRHREVGRFYFFYGAKLLGGEGTPGIGLLGIGRLEDAVPLLVDEVRRVGEDVLVEGRLEPLRAP